MSIDTLLWTDGKLLSIYYLRTVNVCFFGMDSWYFGKCIYKK